MTSDRTEAMEAAIDWLSRQRDPAFDDWHAFTLWLEADAAHAACYQELMELDAALAAELGRSRAQVPEPAPAAPAKRWWSRRAAGGLAAAAVLVAALGYGILKPQGTYEVATADGQRRHILLADGSRIVLNSNSRIRLDRTAPRSVQLDAGEALFDVVHDPQKRFRVRFGDDMVENLGTRFTVLRRGEASEVAVSQGAVAVRSGGQTIEIEAGQKLDRQQLRWRVSPVDMRSVGPWATPRLTYDDAPLSRVGADLARELGVGVEVAPAIANRRITASIQLDIDTERSMERLGPLLDVTIARRGAGWLVTAPR